MREIKFRAWDALSKKMIDDALHLPNQEANNLANVLKDSSKVVMQYTGLKDKNGKEIYEGDVVKLLKVINGEGDIATLEFSAPNYYLKGKNGEYSFSEKPIPECFEVIGNIYENPKLLEVK